MEKKTRFYVIHFCERTQRLLLEIFFRLINKFLKQNSWKQSREPIKLVEQIKKLLLVMMMIPSLLTWIKKQTTMSKNVNIFHFATHTESVSWFLVHFALHFGSPHTTTRTQLSDSSRTVEKKNNCALDIFETKEKTGHEWWHEQCPATKNNWKQIRRFLAARFRQKIPRFSKIQMRENIPFIKLNWNVCVCTFDHLLLVFVLHLSKKNVSLFF